MEPVRIEGIVVPGRRLGRELGFPTANLSAQGEVAAEDGVYASWAEVDGVRYRPICSGSGARSTASG